MAFGNGNTLTANSKTTKKKTARHIHQAIFTRRVADVVSEACFTVMTGDRHDERAAMNFSMIIFAQTPS